MTTTRVVGLVLGLILPLILVGALIHQAETSQEPSGYLQAESYREAAASARRTEAIYKRIAAQADRRCRDR